MKKLFLLMLTMAFSLGAAQAIENIQNDNVTPPPPPAPECEKIVYQKWNDLLFVDNGDGRFVAYQWYKNREAMPGETGQYIYHEGVVLKDDGALYYVIATTTDGTQVMSCEHTFNDFPRSAESNPGVVKKAALYTFTGNKVGEWSERPAVVPVAHGYYIWRMTDAEGRQWSEKVTY